MNLKEYDTQELEAVRCCTAGDIRRADKLKDARLSHDLRCALDQITAELESRTRTVYVGREDAESRAREFFCRSRPHGSHSITGGQNE